MGSGSCLSISQRLALGVFKGVLNRCPRRVRVAVHQFLLRRLELSDPTDVPDPPPLPPWFR